MEKSEFEHIAKDVRAAALKAALIVGAGEEDAEDTAQEVTLKLWTLHEDISDDAHAVRLAACSARNLAISGLRKRRTVSLDSTIISTESHNETPDTSLEEDEDTAWMMEKMAQLPPKEYEILRLRQVELKTNEEIAQMLGMSKASVATMLSRARTKLLNDIKRRMKR